MRLLKLISMLLGCRYPKTMANAIYHTLEDLKYRRYVSRKGFASGFPTIHLPLEETISNYTFLDGTSGVTDIALLRSLSCPECDYLEIGTFRGESFYNVRSKHSVSVSLDQGQVIFKKPGRYIQADSSRINFDELGKFDLIFIDGDHSYKSIKNDTINAFKLLKDDDSIIVWHDYGKTFETINWTTVAAIVDGCGGKNIYHVAHTLCCIYSPSSLPKMADKIFTVTIK
jgi:hypothetical protein